MHCPPIFGHISMQNINKNYPLLTDGDNIYIIGKRLAVEKLDLKKEEKKDEKKEEKEEETPVQPQPQST